MADLYRKSALEKISNPEQLDKALVVTSPLSWLALVAVTLILVVTVVWSVVGRIPETLTLGGYVVPGNGNVAAIYSDWNGTVQKIHVRTGDPIYDKTELVTITQPDGSKRTIVSAINGLVTQVAVQEGLPLTGGSPILYFAPTDGQLNQINSMPVLREQLVVCYVPSKAGSDMSGQLKQGNRVHLTPAGENSQSAGHMLGTVLYVEKYNASQNSVQLVTGSDQIYADAGNGNGSIKAAVILLDERQDGTPGKNPYVWSNPKGQNLHVDNGDTFTVRIIVKEVRPIEKLFAKIGEVLGW